MKEYKCKIEDIKNLFWLYEESRLKAYELPSEEYNEVINLLEESKKFRAKAVKKLNKLAEDCGFKIMQDIKYDYKFQYVVNSIESQIDDAIEALHRVPRFDHNIELA